MGYLKQDRPHQTGSVKLYRIDLSAAAQDAPHSLVLYL
jgi:hypothetical protein